MDRLLFSDEGSNGFLPTQKYVLIFVILSKSPERVIFFMEKKEYDN